MYNALVRKQTLLYSDINKSTTGPENKLMLLYNITVFCY
jgi:hypothetical protein